MVSRRVKLQRKQKVLSRMIDALILGKRLVLSENYIQTWIHDGHGTVFFQWYDAHDYNAGPKPIEYKEAADLVEKYWSKRNYVGRISKS